MIGPRVVAGHRVEMMGEARHLCLLIQFVVPARRWGRRCSAACPALVRGSGTADAAPDRGRAGPRGGSIGICTTLAIAPAGAVHQRVARSTRTGFTSSLPRRFNTVTASWPSCASSASRNGAAIACATHAGTSPQHAPGASLARSHGEPPQDPLVMLGQPRERRSAFRRAQRLIEGPQRFLRRAATHQRKPAQRNARRDERRRMRPVGRRDPDDFAAGMRQLGECRQREAKLADAFACKHDLGQRIAWPAAARQHLVERGKAGRQRLRLGRAIAAAPEGRMGKQRGECGVHRRSPWSR